MSSRDSSAGGSGRFQCSPRPGPRTVAAASRRTLAQRAPPDAGLDEVPADADPLGLRARGQGARGRSPAPPSRPWQGPDRPASAPTTRAVTTTRGPACDSPPLRRAGSTKQPRPGAGVGSFHGPRVVRTSPLDVVIVQPEVRGRRGQRPQGRRGRGPRRAPAGPRRPSPGRRCRRRTRGRPRPGSRPARIAARAGRPPPGGSPARARPGSTSAPARGSVRSPGCAAVPGWPPPRRPPVDPPSVGRLRARLSRVMAVAGS